MWSIYYSVIADVRVQKHVNVFSVVSFHLGTHLALNWVVVKIVSHIHNSSQVTCCNSFDFYGFWTSKDFTLLRLREGAVTKTCLRHVGKVDPLVYRRHGHVAGMSEIFRLRLDKMYPTNVVV